MAITINYAICPSEITNTSGFKNWLYTELNEDPVEDICQCSSSIREFSLSCFEIIPPYEISPRVPNVKLVDRGLTGDYALYRSCVCITIKGSSTVSEEKFKEVCDQVYKLSKRFELIEEFDGALSSSDLVDDDEIESTRQEQIEAKKVYKLNEAFPGLSKSIIQLLSEKVQTQNPIKVELIDKSEYYSDIRIQISASETDFTQAYPVFYASVPLLNKLVKQVTTLEVRFQIEKYNPKKRSVFEFILNRFRTR